MMAACCDLC